MSKAIEIEIGGRKFDGQLNDTKIAEELYNILPVSGKGKKWGDEIYMNTPLDIENEKPQSEVEVGTIAYWPPGNGFCVLFGPTPASQGEKPTLSSPGTVIGKIQGDPEKLKKIDNYEMEVRKKGGE